MAHLVESFDEILILAGPGVLISMALTATVLHVSVRLGLELFDDGWIDFGDGSGGGGVILKEVGASRF